MLQHYVPFAPRLRSAGLGGTPINVVVPIGGIVAIAIVSMVIAVLSSARRADEAALTQEIELFNNGVGIYAERVLRDLMSFGAATRAITGMPSPQNRTALGTQVQRWLDTVFHYDHVFIVDRAGNVLFPIDRQAADSGNRRRELEPVLSLLRGVAPRSQISFRVLSDNDLAQVTRPPSATLMQTFAGQPALIAGVAATNPAGDAAADAPRFAIVLVRNIGNGVVDEIAGRLQLRNLRLLAASDAASGDHVHHVTGRDGHIIARFAWSPQRPSALIITSVIPFMAVAFGGFALLVTLVLLHMRRTSKTIAASESRLRHLAMHDPLCGLLNRTSFMEQLDHLISEVRNGSAPAAVFYLDLDHFKDVNDTLGHHVGDELICLVATRLRYTMQDEEIIARLGGDEFAIITGTTLDAPALHGLAGRIISALCAPYTVAGQVINIGASIGIALVDRQATGPADVMRYADMALYRAKNEGRNRACIYDATMDADILYRKQLQDDLRAAIVNDKLRLDYQPVVNASGEKLLGVEALTRWRHPEHGEVSPSEFISIAESSGLIFDLGAWVLRQACSDGKAWPELTVAVNVSPQQFRRADFVDMVESVLAETGFDPHRLELEVTESTLFGNVESAQAAMLRLKTLGVKLALDDFGTGYSSLQYLRRFPFDRLKIDHSFVRSIETAADAAAIVHAVVSLGRGLGMKVTAEGVETAEQHLFLRAAGVHAMQGYRFGRPAPAAAVAERLRAAKQPPEGSIAAVG